MNKPTTINQVAREKVLERIAAKKTAIIKAVSECVKTGIDALAEAECCVLTEPLEDVERILLRAADLFDFQLMDDAEEIKGLADVVKEIRESEKCP